MYRKELLFTPKPYEGGTKSHHRHYVRPGSSLSVIKTHAKQKTSIRCPKKFVFTNNLVDAAKNIYTILITCSFLIIVRYVMSFDRR